MKRTRLFIISLAVVLGLTSIASWLQPSVSAANTPVVKSGGQISDPKAAAAATTLNYTLGPDGAGTGAIHVKMKLDVVDDHGRAFTYSFNDDFADRKLFDAHHVYEFPNCDNNKSTVTVGGLGYQNATLDLWTKNPGNGNACTNIKYGGVLVSNPNNGKTTFAWTSADTITMAPEEDGVAFALQVDKNNPNKFSVSNVQHTALLGDLCANDAFPGCTQATDGDLTLQDPNHGSITLRTHSSDSTGATANYGPTAYTVIIAGSPTHPVSSAAVTGSAGSGGSGNGGPTGPPSCESEGFSLSWIFCPIINGLANAADSIYSEIIQPLLETKPIQLSNTGSDPAHIYAIWSNFRIYGDIFLVIALLVIVFGESIGGGAIDAYAVKKVLPRLLVAVVLINLSIYIVSLALDITNIIGRSVGALIQEPFQSVAGGFKLHLSGGGGALGMGVLVAGVSWGAFSLGFLPFIFLLLLLPAFLALVGILVTVVLRQGIIIFLVLVSPIAFALYCLPNTEQYFKKWWDLLFKTLMVYPLIAIIFALANVLSVSIAASFSTSTPAAKTISEVIAAFALIAPLFMIPFAFRMAGGVIGQIHNAVSKASAPVFNKLGKKRGAISAARSAEWHAGGLAQDRGIGKIVNSAGRRAAVGYRGHYGMGARGKAALGIATLANNEQTLKGDAQLNELRNNDDANAVMGLSGGTAGGAREAMRELFTDSSGNYNQVRAERAYAAASAVGFRRDHAAAALQTMAQNKSRAITEGGVDILQNGINRLAGGNTQEAENMAYNYQYFSREAGRGDLGGNWMDPALQGRATALAARSPGMTQQEAMRHTVALDGMGRTEVSAMARGYPQQLRQSSQTLRQMMTHGNVQERSLAATRILELQKALPYASGDNQKIINELLEHPDIGVDYTHRDSIEQQLVNSANRTGATGLTAESLSRGARTYDQQQATSSGGPTPII